MNTSDSSTSTSGPEHSTGKNSTNTQWDKSQYTIEGMHCAGCVNSVKTALESVEGVRNVNVNLVGEKAYLEQDSSKVSVEKLSSSVEKAGYKLIPDKQVAKDLGSRKKREEEKLRQARMKLWVSWGMTLPGMLVMIAQLLFGSDWISMVVMDVVMVISVLLVLLFPGRETVRSALISTRNLSPNMDVLIAMGSLASLVTGLFVLSDHAGLSIVSIHNFAGVGAMILSFHLTGRFIEAKARGRTSEAITKLLSLQAQSARVLREGAEMEIPLQDLIRGDVVMIRTGEKVPADGVVLDGQGAVNESLLTGESLPVQKTRDYAVIGGSILEEGALKVRVDGVGEETFLNRVVQLVEEAQSTRVPIQELADRVTSYFVPAVLVLSLLTFLSWIIVPNLYTPVTQWASTFLPWVTTDTSTVSNAFFAALAVLVIACPCALGLATPTALMVGSGLGAENGVLIRNGEAIQRLREATHIVLDKTGTVTTGKPEVTDLIFMGENESGNGVTDYSVRNREDQKSLVLDVTDAEQADLLRNLYAVENLSEHPVARAIVDCLNANGFTSEKDVEYKSWPGMGVQGRIGEQEYHAGNRSFIDKFQISLTQRQEERAHELEKEGKSVTYVAAEGKVRLLLAVSDALKPESAQVIQQLVSEGYNMVLLSGDSQVVADAVAKEIGISRVIAGVRPDAKADEIQKLQDSGAVVVMVGDGVNDAPSLAKADVGIAIGTGTDIAIESGGIILVDGKLTSLLKAIILSQSTFRKIRQNLFWAYFYNIIMIPLAIIGVLHPLLAESAMALSSINVILNSRRIRL